MTIRKKLLINFGLVMILLFSIISFILMYRNYNVTNSSNEHNHSAIIDFYKLQIDGIANSSIANYLRSGVYQQLEYAKQLNEDVKQGNITLEDAQNKFKDFALKLKFGKTGYAYSMNTKGILTQHYKIEGKDLSKYDFVQKMIKKKNGVVYYNWENRDKIVYIGYFKPWDWIMTSSGYIDEFRYLVDIDAIRKSINNIKFDKFDYAFIIDGNGKIIVHPTKEGGDISNDALFKNMIVDTTGIVYGNTAITPDEYKNKDAVIRYFKIPKMNWICGIAFYNNSLKAEKKNALAMYFVILLLVVVIIFLITHFTSKGINDAIQGIVERFDLLAKDLASGKLQKKIDLRSRFEDFNPMLNSVVTIGKAFKAILNYTVAPIVIIDDNNKILYVNKATEKLLNYNKHDLIDFDFTLKSNISEELLGRNIFNTTRFTKDLDVVLNNESKILSYTSIPIEYENKIQSNLILLVDITDVTNLNRKDKDINLYINNEINKISAELEKLSQGNLNLNYNVDAFDENTKDAAKQFKVIEKALKITEKQLKEIIFDIKNEANGAISKVNKVIKYSDDMHKSNNDIAQKSLNASENTDKVNENINTLASSVEEMSINAGSVAQQSEQLNENMNTVSSAIEEMSVQIKNVLDNTNKTKEISIEATQKSDIASTQMEQLGSAANGIGKVTDVIKKIAEQTNLLALNATIEAASAGEAGKGFAVVANEIKELASQSARAAEDIAQKINDIQLNSKDSIEIIGDMKIITQKMAEAVDLVSTNMYQQNEAVGEITSSTVEAKQGVENITANISEIAIGVKEAAHHLGAASDNVQELATVTLSNNKISNDNINLSDALNSEILDLNDKNIKIMENIKRLRID